jgi:hypothetical protein
VNLEDYRDLLLDIGFVEAKTQSIAATFSGRWPGSCGREHSSLT